VLVEQQERLLHRLDRRHQVRGRALLVALELAAIGDVADPGDHQQAALGGERRQADLDRELAAVLAPAVEIEVGAHRARPRLGDVRRQVMAVPRSHVLGDQYLDRAAEQLVVVVAEHPLGRRVDQHQHAAVVAHHDAVGRGVEQGAERDVPVTEHG
jgi:hypothetical protein